MRVDADGHGDVVDLVVGEQAVALDFPRVEHLAAQGQDRLRLLVAAHLGTAAGRVAFDEEQLVVQQVAALAVGELARQHGHARAAPLLDLLAGALARLRLADHQVGELAAPFDMLVEPQLERRLDAHRHQPQCIAAVEPFLDLTLELRIEHLGAEHEARTRKHVVGHELHALGQKPVQVDEVLDGAEQAVLQTGLVHPAIHGRDEVDVALAHRRAVVGEGDAPRGALTRREVVALAGVDRVFALEGRNDGIGRQGLQQVVAQAALVLPGLYVVAFFVGERDAGAGHQHRLAAQQVRQFGARQIDVVEVLRVGPRPHRGAALSIACGRGRTGGTQSQRLDHVARGKGDLRDLAFTPHAHFEAFRQRIGHAHAHAVQATRKAVGAARTLVELAAGVQLGEDDLHHRPTFIGMQSERDSAPVVLHAHRTVGVERHVDALTVACERLVCGVVDHLLHDVQRVVGPGVHARTLLHWLESLEDADRVFGIACRGGGRRCLGRGKGSGSGSLGHAKGL